MHGGIVLVLALTSVLAALQAAAAPTVAGFERFGRSTADPVQTIESGLLLLGELGCVNCHAPPSAQAVHLAAKRGPHLDRVGERLDPRWIATYLRDPHAVAPHTTMPHAIAHVPESSREEVAAALTAFLTSTDTFAAASVNQGNATEGSALFNRIGCATCHGQLGAADHLPDQVPLQGLAAKWSPASLEQFIRDPLAVRPSSRMPAFAMNDQESKQLAACLLGERPAAGDEPPKPDEALIARGREAFASVGCASCHDLPGADGKPIAPASAARPLAEVAPERGCLATARQPGSGPDYGLDDAQRAAIKAALAWLATTEAQEPPKRERRIDRTLTALNCYACHVRDGRGGTELAVPRTDDDGEPITKDAARDALFTSLVQELGDEGRLPPTLTGVGDKLNGTFLHHVILKGNNDRRIYMHTRMPRWHAAVAEPLAALLAEDVTTTGQASALAGHAPQTIMDGGRFLVGSKALGCIKCHAFTSDRGQSLGVISMMRFPYRLRREWFLAYVADPQRFRPGTRMPASWPEGKVFFTDLLGGSAAAQIESVWRYVSSQDPPPPVGIDAQPIELVATTKPVLYRNFIKDAGPRAIGVGYPEKVNIAWDAEALRLALVWKGSFIDAARHWSGRGMGWQRPLGDACYSPDAAAPIAVLEAPDAPWPDTPIRDRGGKFRGYSLDAAGRPTFTWSLGGLEVKESFEPGADAEKPLLRRTLRVRRGSAEGTAVFRACTADKIEDLADGWMWIDGFGKIRVEAPGELSRVRIGTRTELRYPIDAAVSPATETVIVEELSW
jgi:mono/diheme cytochrome c family protein